MKNTILKIFIGILIIVIVVLVYGAFIEPVRLTTKEIKVVSDTITDNFDGFKVVQISDIHYGTTVDKEMFESIVNEINLLKPDIVLLTGDLFNSKVNLAEESYQDITEVLKNINANIGKYAIKGDNDTNEKWEDIIKNSEFIDLNDRYELLYDNGNIPIILSGISSNSSYGEINEKIAKIDEYINTVEIKPCYSILILHEPDYVDNIDVSNYNLILAGHSLGGINIPIIGRVNLPNGATKYSHGKYSINNTDLYVSNGLGTDKRKFRLGSKPTINFYRIVK
ncbi:MAG: metallophosphoesterase [Bacilli bacterium]|nr:metallophosphoesterase [Bacilli bacterium]